MNSWIIFLIIFLVSAVIYNQFFKLGLNKSKNIGSYMALISILTGIFALLFIPIFKFKFQFNIYKFILLIITCLLYAIVDRMNVYIRKYVDVSIFSILRQLSNVFMIIMGFTFFKEKFVLYKFIGAILIIFSNVLVLYDKTKRTTKKILFIGILANLLFALTLFLNVNLSKSYNIPIYVSFIVLIPGLFICIYDKIGIKKLRYEFINGETDFILITSLAGAIMLISQLRAYELGNVSLVASLCSLTVMLNVLVSYFILNEKNRMVRKILSSLIILISIILIKI